MKKFKDEWWFLPVAIVLIAAAIVILRLRHSDKLGLKRKKSK